MSEVQFTIPAVRRVLPAVSRCDGQVASQHRIIGWGVTKDREMMALTHGGAIHDGLHIGHHAARHAALSAANREVRREADWLSAVRERWEAADAETTAALLAAREEGGVGSAKEKPPGGEPGGFSNRLVATGDVNNWRTAIVPHRKLNATRPRQTRRKGPHE